MLDRNLKRFPRMNANVANVEETLKPLLQPRHASEVEQGVEGLAND